MSKFKIFSFVLSKNKFKKNVKSFVKICFDCIYSFVFNATLSLRQKYVQHNNLKKEKTKKKYFYKKQHNNVHNVEIVLVLVYVLLDKNNRRQEKEKTIVYYTF